MAEGFQEGIFIDNNSFLYVVEFIILYGFSHFYIQPYTYIIAILELILIGKSVVILHIAECSKDSNFLGELRPSKPKLKYKNLECRFHSEFS